MVRYMTSWRMAGTVAVAINGTRVATLTSAADSKYTLPAHYFHDLAAPGEFDLALRTVDDHDAKGSASSNFSSDLVPGGGVVAGVPQEQLQHAQHERPPHPMTQLQDGRIATETDFGVLALHVG